MLSSKSYYAMRSFWRFALRKIIEFFLNFWIRILVIPLRVFGKKNNSGRLSERVMIIVSKMVEKYSPVFVSSMLRRKDTSILPFFPTLVNKGKIAIVLQGPIMDENNFTINTVKFYKTYNPDFLIIVSTWKDASAEAVKSLELLGSIVVQTATPEYGGYGNINYQLISTCAGIRKALELGADYICKTRTDQRIEEPYAFDMMKNLINVYPIEKKKIFSSRVIGIATEYGSLFQPYYISDFLYFGSAKDIENWLFVELDNREKFSREGMTRKQIADSKGIAEIYIIKSIIDNCGGEYDNTIKSYWQFVKENMILIDKSMIKLYWPKYDTRYCEHIRNGNYSIEELNKKNRLSNFGFSSWLALLNGDLIYEESFEDFLDETL